MTCQSVDFYRAHVFSQEIDHIDIKIHELEGGYYNLGLSYEKMSKIDKDIDELKQSKSYLEKRLAEVKIEIADSDK